MKLPYWLVLAVSCMPAGLSAQAVDTTYIASYPQTTQLTGFVASKFILVEHEEVEYQPNYPLTVGLGLAIRNTVINLAGGYGGIPLRGKEYGKSKVLDFQMHRYGRRFLLDLYYQDYRGFYREEPNLILYPDLAVRQIGIEGTYVVRGNQFSARAAFEQSERQLRSAGSLLYGGGLYWHRLDAEGIAPSSETPVDNVQAGVNVGYAYSWVVNKRWILSGMATVGANFGNVTDRLSDGSIKVYPAVFARGSASYSVPDGAIAFSFLANNKYVYAAGTEQFTLTAFNMQFSYTRNLNLFPERKRKS